MGKKDRVPWRLPQNRLREWDAGKDPWIPTLLPWAEDF